MKLRVCSQETDCDTEQSQMDSKRLGLVAQTAAFAIWRHVKRASAAETYRYLSPSTCGSVASFSSETTRPGGRLAPRGLKNPSDSPRLRRTPGIAGPNSSLALLDGRVAHPHTESPVPTRASETKP